VGKIAQWPDRRSNMHVQSCLECTNYGPITKRRPLHPILTHQVKNTSSDWLHWNWLCRTPAWDEYFIIFGSQRVRNENRSSILDSVQQSILCNSEMAEPEDEIHAQSERRALRQISYHKLFHSIPGRYHRFVCTVQSYCNTRGNTLLNFRQCLG
jgi:hypothetical protein